MGNNGFYQFHYYYIPRVGYGWEIEPMSPKIRLYTHCEPAGRSQTRPAEVLRTRHHTGRRPSFRCLAVGLAITGFINFTTIIYRVSAMAWEIEPMSSKIRLWPCEPVGRIRPGRWRIFKPVGSFPLLPFPTAVYNNSVLYKNERRAYGSILHRPPTKGLPHDFYVI